MEKKNVMSTHEIIISHGIDQKNELFQLKQSIKKLLESDTDAFAELSEHLIMAYKSKKRTLEQLVVEKLKETTSSC